MQKKKKQEDRKQVTRVCAFLLTKKWTVFNKYGGFILIDKEKKKTHYAKVTNQFAFNWVKKVFDPLQPSQNQSIKTHMFGHLFHRERESWVMKQQIFVWENSLNSDLI